MPAFTLTLIVAVFFNRFRKSNVMIYIMSFVKPVCIAMILAVICILSIENYGSGGKPDWIAILIGLGMFWLILKKKWSVPRVIGCSALLGIVLYGIAGTLPAG